MVKIGRFRPVWKYYIKKSLKEIMCGFIWLRTETSGGLL
jgi:hypothetical protein